MAFCLTLTIIGCKPETREASMNPPLARGNANADGPPLAWADIYAGWKSEACDADAVKRARAQVLLDSLL